MASACPTALDLVLDAHFEIEADTLENFHRPNLGPNLGPDLLHDLDSDHDLAHWRCLCPVRAAHPSPGQRPGLAKALDSRALKERRILKRGKRRPHPPRCGVPQRTRPG